MNRRSKLNMTTILLFASLAALAFDFEALLPTNGDLLVSAFTSSSLLTSTPSSRSSFGQSSSSCNAIAGAAASFEEDLALTIKVIMDHQERLAALSPGQMLSEVADEAPAPAAVAKSPNSNELTPPMMPVTPFDDGVSPFEITTPIYYVNAQPHIGHAYTSVACDVMARYHRLSGRKVWFVSGTDEHGQKVEQSAEQKGVPPQQFVDEVSQSFRDLLELMNISNDKFVRTTDADHKQAAKHFWNLLKEKGYIYKGTYSGWYSVRDECFYNESELIDGKAPTGADVEWVAKEESYFFKLSAFQDKLLALYEEEEDFVGPATRKNEVVSFVKSGLLDLSVSRTSFSWGVPVPDDEEHVMYVWMDALTNYLTALGYPDETNESKMKEFWPASLHVVGKDILRFHAVYWPAFLMAADLPVPKRLFAHGWWTKDGNKISKSLGNVIDPVELVNTYGVDPVRFFFMSEVPFGNDGDYSDTSMVYKCNANLSNELGNLCQRVCLLVYKNCNQAIPFPTLNPATQKPDYTPEDVALLAAARKLRSETAVSVANQELHIYSRQMVRMVKDANKYIDEQAPWALKKTDPERMATVLYVLLEVLRYTAVLYQPLIPESANKILDQLTVPVHERTFAHLAHDDGDDQYALTPGTPMEQAVAVFPRFEVPGAEDEKGKDGATTSEAAAGSQKKQKIKKKQKNGKQQPNNAAANDVMDLSKLDIRVGVITKAWEHEDADKLFCEEINIGEETRQIASGLREHYQLPDLEGQRVLVLANLKSRKLVGFPSHGMVLCASKDDVVEFVEPPADAAIGERVYVQESQGDPATPNQVGKKKMLDLLLPDLKTDGDGTVTYKGDFLMTSAGPCRARTGLSDASVS